MSIKNQFEELIASLSEDPTIEVIWSSIEDGTNLGNSSLPNDLVEFYTQINGLQLVWLKKTNPFFKDKSYKKRSQPFSWLEMWEDDFAYDGSIMLLPYDISFGNSWENKVWYKAEERYSTSFRGKKMSMLEFKKRIIPFDLFNRYYSVSYFKNDPDLDHPLLLGQDFGADYTSSKLYTLKEYLKLLISTKGHVKSRAEEMKAPWGNLD